MTDAYRTIAATATGAFRDRGSRFLAYAFPIESERDVPVLLEDLRRQHPKARHFCYAWRLGLDKNHYRSNDDGEPSGTAGKPILGQIDSFTLTHVFVVVVRYFGGTLLGTSGLITAYKSSARAALEAAEIIEKTIEDVYRITVEYALLPDVMQALKKVDMPILSQVFEDRATLEVRVRQSAAAGALLRMKALIAKISLEEAAILETVNGLHIERLGTR